MANQLKKNAFAGVKGPVVTIVMDGVGIAPENAGNAVYCANTPTLDRIMKIHYNKYVRHPAGFFPR